MKRSIYKVMVLAVLLAIPAATLFAQQTGSRFTVPFSFVANGYELPAGDYFVEGLWWNAVSFHNGEGHANLIIMAQQAPRTQEVKTRLIFHKYGDHYLLMKAELPNMDYGRAFQTVAVSHVIKLAGNVTPVKPEIVEVLGK